MNTPKTHFAGALISLAGFTLWVLTDACVKFAADSGIAAVEVAFFITLTGTIALALKASASGTLNRLRPHNVKIQFISACVCVFAFMSCVVALQHLPFIIFYIAVFTTPLITAILAALFLREYMTGGKIAAVLVGFIGVAIANNPLNMRDLHGDWVGYAAIFVNVFSFATLMVIQRGAMQEETWESVAFIQAALQAVIFGIVAAFSFTAPSSFLMLLLLGAGLLSICGNICNIVATKKTTTATVAQFQYTQIISGAILGFLIWGEVPTIMLIAGSILIIVSGLYIAHHSRKADRMTIIKPL